MDDIDHGGSRVVASEPCPECGSSDNVRVYDDGHKHCFGAGCGYHTRANNDNPTTRRTRMAQGLIEGEFRALPPRGLSVEACRKFGVKVGKIGQDPVTLMEYRDQDGTVVAQKVRRKDKTFTILGDPQKMKLFGQHLWPSSGRKVVVTEGELDAVALCQTQDLKWPVVSIPNGASNARKALAASRQWLEGYDEIVLAFDADEAGRTAVSEGAAVLTPGKVRVADFGPYGFKDANEAVLNHQEKDLLKAVWDARPWRPDGVVSLRDIRDRVLIPAEHGAAWPWPSLTAATFGRRKGELIGIGAGTGVGKSDLFTQTIAHDVALGIRCGVLALEQDVGETGKRIAGKMVGKRFHVPDGSWTQEELDAAWGTLEATDAVKFFDNFGAMDWATIKARIQFMHDVEGCEHIFLDHLTALAAGEADERQALERIMAEAAAMAKGRFVLHYVSHLATPEGKSHEEGGRVTIRHFKGARAIGFWSHFMFGLERDQQAETEDERCVTTLRCLKDRNTGQATGKTFRLKYDATTGLLKEDDAVEFNEEINAPF